MFYRSGAAELPPGLFGLCGEANPKALGPGDASATLLANELLRRAAERASAGGRSSAPGRRGICRRRRGRGRNTGVLAGHCERVAVDLTCERRLVQGRRRDGHGIHRLAGLSENFGCERRATENHERRQHDACHRTLSLRCSNGCHASRYGPRHARIDTPFRCEYPSLRVHPQTREPVDGEADGLPQPRDCYLIMSAPILQISASWSPVPPLRNHGSCAYRRSITPAAQSISLRRVSHVTSASPCPRPRPGYPDRRCRR